MLVDMCVHMDTRRNSAMVIAVLPAVTYAA